MQSNVTQQRAPVIGDTAPWIHVSESPRHVRVFFGGETIADSKRAKLVRESDVLPAYYFPREDVRLDLFTPSAHTSRCPLKGEASYWSIRTGRKSVEDAAWSYPSPYPGAAAIKEHFAFDWPKMDKWMEEDEELFKRDRGLFKHGHAPRLFEMRGDERCPNKKLCKLRITLSSRKCSSRPYPFSLISGRTGADPAGRLPPCWRKLPPSLLAG